MHLIAPLASGVFGAANGTAEVYARGTGARASWYSDFEGHQVFGSGADIALDGNGGAVVYVNELVDVVVRDATGTLVRQFTAGDAAPNTEVRSLSFTGADYDTAASGAGKPTTLQAVLDAWLTSAGAVDFKVDVSGVATLLKDATAGRQFFNVKDTVYGAKGDGATDDTSAIQAAMTAASTAGGGWVFFPAGTYRITSALTWNSKVSMIGVGSTYSSIVMDHATAKMFTMSASSNVTMVMNLLFYHQQANSGVMFDFTAVQRSHIFLSCTFGSLQTQGTMFNDGGNQSELRFYGCRFVPRAAIATITNLYMSQCRVVPASWTGATTSLITFSAVGSFTGCEFYPGSITASTVKVLVGGANSVGIITGCRFNVFGSTATGTCITQGTSSEMTVTGCSFGAKSTATAATAMALATGAAFSESGNIFNDTLAALSPDMTPYSYTASASGADQYLGSREFLRTTATQSGGGTKTLDSDIYGHIMVTVSDNTAFTLQLKLAPVGAQFTLDIYASGGAGTGGITFGTNIYGLGLVTGLVTTKHRFYTFRSELVNASHVWILKAASFGDM